MLLLTEEKWWESLPSYFPYGKNTPSRSEIARPHERSALWVYLQNELPAAEAATQIMAIKAEDWDAYQEVCGDCDEVHEHDSITEVSKDVYVAELLFEVAIAQPETIPKILDLIKATDALPPYKLSDKQKLRCPGWQDWSVRDSWEFTIREAYCSWDDDDEYYGDTGHRTPEMLDFLKISARRVAGLNALMAYKAVYELDPDKLPSSRYGRIGNGLCSLGLALEHDAWNHPHRILGDHPRIEMFDYRGLNELVITAMPWLTIAGHIFYRCLDREEYQDWDASGYIIGRFGAFAYLYYGKSGLCFDRWNFWKERLEWIQKADLTEKAKVAAKEALERMEVIEQGENRTF